MSAVRLETTVPHGRTARRLEWAHLPPHIRAVVEEHCGAPVLAAESQGAGFTPGFASVLTCADGSQHFVKAASIKAQRSFAEAYREEALKLAALPETAPAPRLLWTHDADDWVVLATEYVDARAPHRPWRAADLERALELTATMAAALTPAPAEPELPTFAEDYADWPGYWDRLRTAAPDLSGLPGFTDRLDEAAALAARLPEVAAGSTLVHADIRDDNILFASDGRTLLCDWNFPVVGPAWLDTVFLMIGPRGDGHDVDALLAAAPLLRDVPTDAVDVVIALLTGYFLFAGAQPVPPTSPYVRAVQRWQGEVCWSWLCERRGWA